MILSSPNKEKCLGVIVLLQNKVFPNQSLPRENGMPLQYRVVSMVIEDAHHPLSH